MSWPVMRGLFVAFEGIDACGKSTQLQRAADALRGDGIAVTVSREPGGTRISEKIRDVVMSAEHDEMTVACEVLLYLAARAQHVTERIRPAVESGAVVLCDRFCDATMAYQGYGREVAPAVLEWLNEYATGGLLPDITFLFDISVELSRARLAQARQGLDRMERASGEFFEKVRNGYLALARLHPERIVVIAAEQPVESIAGQVIEIIRGRYRAFQEA